MNNAFNDAQEEQRLARKLAEIQSEMRRLDAKDDLLMARAYADPEDATNRMVEYREENGEIGLYEALRANPDCFGEYPKGETHFNDAYQARKELPVVFANYQKLRDEADITQIQLDRLRRERDGQTRHEEERQRR